MSAVEAFEMVRLGLGMAQSGLESLARDTDEGADPLLIQAADALSLAARMFALCKAPKGMVHV